MLVRLFHHAPAAAAVVVIAGFVLAMPARAEQRSDELTSKSKKEPGTRAEVKAAAKASAQAIAKTDTANASAVIALDHTALKLKRDDVRQLYLQAKQQVRFGQYSAGLKSFREVYRRAGLADVLFDMAGCEARLGRMPAALALHRRYVRSFKQPVARLVAAARFGSIVKSLQARKRHVVAVPASAAPGSNARARNRP